MENFEIQIIQAGKITRNRPFEALWDGSLWVKKGEVGSSGYIVNALGERVAIFETVGSHTKINGFCVGSRHTNPRLKRPFTVLWDGIYSKRASQFGSFTRLLTALASRQ
jgi:hypothetical protein